MKILVTGASGFLGRRAAAYFEKLGWAVLKPTHSELDITDREAVHAWLRQNRPEAVLHCAAVSDTAACRQDPERSEKINVHGSVFLAQAAAEVGAKFVFCSSDQVYASSDFRDPHREEEQLFPQDVYAYQKLRAERLCAAVCPNTVSLRLSWMFSSDFYPDEHSHLLKALAAAMQDETKPISWPIYDRRSITDVDMVVQNLPAALDLPAGVYNFGSFNDRSTHDTINKLFSRLGRHDLLPRIVPNTEAFKDGPRNLCMDVSKAEAFGIAFPETADALYLAMRCCDLCVS